MIFMSLATHIAHTHTLTSMQKSTTNNTGMGNRKNTCDFLRFFSFYFVLFSCFNIFCWLDWNVCYLFVCLASWKATKQAVDLQMSSRFLLFLHLLHTSVHSRARGVRVYTHLLCLFSLRLIPFELKWEWRLWCQRVCYACAYTIHTRTFSGS